LLSRVGPRSDSGANTPGWRTPGPGRAPGSLVYLVGDDVSSCSAANLQRACARWAGRASRPVGLSGSVSNPPHLCAAAPDAPRLQWAARPRRPHTPPPPRSPRPGTARRAGARRACVLGAVADPLGWARDVAPMASSNPNSSALLPGPQTTSVGAVGVPRRAPYRPLPGGFFVQAGTNGLRFCRRFGFGQAA